MAAKGAASDKVLTEIGKDVRAETLVVIAHGVNDLLPHADDRVERIHGALGDESECCQAQAAH